MKKFILSHIYPIAWIMVVMGVITVTVSLYNIIKEFL